MLTSFKQCLFATIKRASISLFSFVTKLLLKLLSKAIHQVKHIQRWELAAAFDNAVVNTILCWFTTPKNAVVQVFTYLVFFFRFYSVIDNYWKISLTISLTILHFQYQYYLLQYLLEIRGGQRPVIASFFILTGYKDHHDYSLVEYWSYY